MRKGRKKRRGDEKGKERKGYEKGMEEEGIR